MNRKMRQTLDLSSPKAKGEKVYTQLQSTRMLNYIIGGMRSLRRIIQVMTGILVAALLVYVIVQNQENDRLSDGLQQIINTRTESRGVTCKKDQYFAEKHNKAMIDDAKGDNDFLDLLATGGGQREPRPQDIPIIDAQKAANNANRDSNLVPVPDCSTPEAITRWFSTGEGTFPVISPDQSNNPSTG